MNANSLTVQYPAISDDVRAEWKRCPDRLAASRAKRLLTENESRIESASSVATKAIMSFGRAAASDDPRGLAIAARDVLAVLAASLFGFAKRIDEGAAAEGMRLSGLPQSADLLVAHGRTMSMIAIRATVMQKAMNESVIGPASFTASAILAAMAIGVRMIEEIECDAEEPVN